MQKSRKTCSASSRLLGRIVLPLWMLLAGDFTVHGDVTNATVVSPVLAYQYFDAVGQVSNVPVVSPPVTYQYFDAPTNVTYQTVISPSVSYGFGYPLNIVSTNRTVTPAETTPLGPAPPVGSDRQLVTFVNGRFTTNAPDPSKMTIVLTHGWIITLVDNGNPLAWPTAMANSIRSNNVTESMANIVAWDWREAAASPIEDPRAAAERTGSEGRGLGVALKHALGTSYSHPIHFIGHSLGTLVNAYAANYLQGTNWASEPVSPTPWPATNMHMTLFDEAEVAMNINGFGPSIRTLIGMNGNPLLSKPYDHPLPRQCVWADNYVSGFGLLHPEAANVILTNNFPTDAPTLGGWFNELRAFHIYPIQWYDETIQNDVSTMGFLWSFERGGLFSLAPPTNSVFIQSGSEWNLAATNWNYGTNLLAARFHQYQSDFWEAVPGSLAQVVANTVTAVGNVLGQLLEVPNTPNFNTIFNLASSPAPPATPGFKAHPLGQSLNDEGGSTNVPAYAWMLLVVPANAVSMSFDYMIQGSWNDDSLAAAFNGTNVLSIPGSQIQTNVVFNSGAIDVSEFAGQTNEFFIGIVGGTSTNAQLTVENLAFSISLPPSLHEQTSGNNCVLSWPLSAADYVLQTSTNLTDTNSWTAITNVPAIVNLQNAVTNSASAGAKFYRLKK